MKTRAFEPTGDLAMRPEAVGLVWPRAPYEEQIHEGVCVLSINGPLEHKGGGFFWCWFETYERILSRFEGAMKCDDVRAILLKIDSPGGECSGLQECTRRMIKMRAEYNKPVIAYADDEAYSAAYQLACVADEIYLPEAGGVGSIGVLATVCDRTEMTKKAGLRVEVIRSGSRKAEGHPDIPLSDATIARVQSRVDGLAKQFFAFVAKSRGVSQKALSDLEGACLYGKKAVDAGLADAVASFDQVLDGMVWALNQEGSFDNPRDLVVPSKPTDRSLGSRGQMNFAALEKRVNDALAAVAAAKTIAARKEAGKELAAAQAALTEAKIKKSYKKRTVEEEEEEDDGEESEDSEDSDSSDDDEPDDDDGGDDTDEEAEEEKKGKKASASLSDFVKDLTGTQSISRARGVLQAMADMASRQAKTEKDVERLKQAKISAKREALITAGLAAGKLKPAQRAWAKTLSLNTLKGYLDTAAPEKPAPREPGMPGASNEPPADATSAVSSVDGLTDDERLICSLTGVTPESFKKQRALVSGTPAPKVN